MCKHPADVRLHRRLGHEQRGGDLSVRQAAGHEDEHLSLAFGQFVERARGDTGASGRWANSSMSRRVTAGASSASPRRHHANRVHELLGRTILQQEPARAGAQRVIDVLVEVERREHQDLGAVVGRR